MHAPQRPRWKAALLGAAVGGAEALLLLVLAFILFLTTTEQGSYAALAGVFLEFLMFAGLPVATLFGGLFGVLLLRKRRPIRYALWTIPLAAFSTATLACIAGTAIYHVVHERMIDREIELQNEKFPHQAVINCTTHAVTNVSLWPFDGHSPTTGFAGDLTEYPPLSSGKPATPELTELHNPDWEPMNEVEVGWGRPAHGSALQFIGSHQDGVDYRQITDIVDVEQKVALSPFQGTRNKVFQITFLPGDKVLVDVIDLKDFKSTVTCPNQHASDTPSRPDRT